MLLLASGFAAVRWTPLGDYLKNRMPPRVRPVGDARGREITVVLNKGGVGSPGKCGSTRSTPGNATKRLGQIVALRWSFWSCQ